jgi:hypothetical protein
MYQDYKDLLSAFHAHGVKYLVVGGFAVIYHAQPRFTKDMNLFIKRTLKTRRRPMPRLPNSAHRSKASVRKISPTATVSFGSGATRKASISFRPFPV